MKTQAVVSREYKVMLRAEKFAGSQKQLLSAARQLWGDFSVAVAPVVVSAAGALDNLEKHRLIVFRDTDAQHLRAGGYILRVRRAIDGRNPELMLKFRHPDRYVCESREMKSRRLRAEAKFEEDIKAPFVSLYSFSARCETGNQPMPSTLDDVARLFPDLSRRLGEIDGRLPLSDVNRLTARELVITGATMRIGSKTATECALIVWYDQNRSATAPVAVEFSYRYGNPKGEYSGKVARRAFDIFATLQSELPGWVDPNPRTKTACVYG